MRSADETRTEHLPNTSLRRYRYALLLITVAIMCVRDEAPNLKTKDMILCSVIKAITH
jgi:hypothetical protein